MAEPKTCLNCPNLRGCRRIIDAGGRVQPNKVVLPPYSVECPGWGPQPIGEKETALRRLLLSKFGMAAIQAVHRLSTVNNLQDEEEDVSEHVDLGSLLYEGITKTQREEQLRYLTDDGGQVLLDEEGQKEPRRLLLVRRYAVQTLGLNPDHMQFCNDRELIKAIIKEEDNLGYFKKSRKPKAAKAVEARPEQPTQPEEKSMPVVTGGKAKVVVRNVAKAKPAGVSKGAVPTKVAAAAKTAKPVTSKKRKGVAAADKPPAEEESSEPTSNVDLQVVRDDIQGIGEDVKQYIDKRMDKVTKELSANIDILRREMVTQHTTLHDVLMYRIQLNVSDIPVVDEENNHLVDEEGAPMYEPYRIGEERETSPEDGLLQAQGQDITIYEVAEGGEMGEE